MGAWTAKVHGGLVDAGTPLVGRWFIWRTARRWRCLKTWFTCPVKITRQGTWLLLRRFPTMCVWHTLERYWKAECRRWEDAGAMSGSLLLAHAQSNRGPRGRKKDFVDAERLVKRLVAQELVLSFVPDSEQRLWRTVVRRKYQLDVRPGAVAKPTGIIVRGSTNQIVQSGIRSSGSQWTTYAQPRAANIALLIPWRRE